MDGPVYEKMMASEEFVEEASASAAEDADQLDQVDAVLQSSSSDDGIYGYVCYIENS